MSFQLPAPQVPVSYEIGFTVYLLLRSNDNQFRRHPGDTIKWERTEL